MSDFYTIPGDCEMCKQWRPLLRWAKFPDPQPVLQPLGAAYQSLDTLSEEVSACRTCGPLWALSGCDIERIKRRPRSPRVIRIEAK